MRRQGGGFGIIMLLVVLAIIAYAAMRNTRSIAPAALEIQEHNKRREVNAEGLAPNAAPTSASDDAWNPTPPSKPSLQTVDQKTSEHSADVKDALSQAN
ncbi:MAG TPA: hypothetical protein VMT33_06470 [Candidatus Bathyarchaeia archaeon]|nr:hypothetical protein [Candidatus Bathyarchaeia archaeon]